MSDRFRRNSARGYVRQNFVSAFFEVSFHAARHAYLRLDYAFIQSAFMGSFKTLPRKKSKKQAFLVNFSQNLGKTEKK